MRILVINSGSSSLKFQVIDSDTEKVLAKGQCERIGIDGIFNYQTDQGVKIKEKYPMANHKEAVDRILTTLVDPERGVISNYSQIDVVGHRLVHGGEKFTGSVVITDEVIEAMRECNDLAPLHNPANIIGVEACRELMPDTLMVGVFDTAFNQTMEPKAFLYGLPYRFYEKHKIRRYGFHGISHKYVSRRAAEFMGQRPDRVKTIVCHLGNGASICAVKYGRVVDNSMGFTPLEGLVMGTRCGDVDAGALEYLSKKENLDFPQIMNILNQESGVLGISKNLSSDFRELKDAEIKYNDTAALAREIFAYRVAKYIGSYAAAMNGVDNIVFTAGVGENDSDIREEICSYLEFLGITIDEVKNREQGEAFRISDGASKINVLVIKTNEELEIAREAAELVKGL
ncbi:MAG TPA: acetate kinase [Candidatus Enterocloster excrementigallinarum]|uniref:Acetate kinase n=1 Tax=Candidatus Enterocloster excrementigallinarum TaxID=2838558 RepID=A0A9D2PVL2_9FIRM|nr:acetate kinase [Candidatus Enterocloster excrementigallinarum]